METFHFQGRKWRETTFWTPKKYPKNTKRWIKFNAMILVVPNKNCFAWGVITLQAVMWIEHWLQVIYDCGILSISTLFFLNIYRRFVNKRNHDISWPFWTKALHEQLNEITTASFVLENNCLLYRPKKEPKKKHEIIKQEGIE